MSALHDGPEASWSELTPKLGWLLAASLPAAALINAGPIAANLLATDDQDALVSNYSKGLFVARVPLFLFQAVQAALLPKLARLAAAGELTEFRVGFRKLLVVVVGTAAIGTAAAFVLGPWAVSLFDATLSRSTITLLALASGLYMIATAIAQAVIALRVTTRWRSGGSRPSPPSSSSPRRGRRPAAAGQPRPGLGLRGGAGVVRLRAAGPHPRRRPARRGLPRRGAPRPPPGAVIALRPFRRDTSA